MLKFTKKNSAALKFGLLCTTLLPFKKRVAYFVAQVLQLPVADRPILSFHFFNLFVDN